MQEYHILNPSEDLIFILRGGPLDLEVRISCTLKILSKTTNGVSLAHFKCEPCICRFTLLHLKMNLEGWQFATGLG